MLRFLTAGESHGAALVAIVDGMPAGLTVDADLIARPIYESRYVICSTPEVAKTLPAQPSQLDPSGVQVAYFATAVACIPSRVS